MVIRSFSTDREKKTSTASIERLCYLYRALIELQGQSDSRISSSKLGELLGIAPHNIRKDINLLGELGETGAGYDVARLRNALEKKLGLDHTRRVAVVGLGRLGRAVLEHEQLVESGFVIVAGFDSNINRLETIRTDVRLYHADEISSVVRKEEIDLGIVTVPSKAAQETADRLIRGGVTGIVNFSPVVIVSGRPEVTVSNIDLVGRLMFLTAKEKMI